MTTDVLVSGLRWATWAFCYLAAFTMGVLLFLGVMPWPVWGRWAGLGVTLALIGWDMQRKLKGDK